MSDYFWSAINYVYDHRLTPAEGAGACASGATVGSPGGYAVAGAGCAISVVSDIISKFFDFTPTTIHEPIGIPTYNGPDCDTSNSCPAPENNPCSDLENGSCPITDFGGFGTNSNDFPTVSSGWGGYNDFVY